MGMFDTIHIKKELPLNEEMKGLNIKWTELEYQTKDLENCLLDYTINEDGTLTENVKEYEFILYTKEEKKNNKDLKPWDIVKEERLLKEENKVVDYHGKILFYCYEILSDEEDVEADFEAYFIYGKLDKIELVKFQKRVTNRKETNKKWEERIKAEERKPWNVFKKYARYIGWRWFWKNVSQGLYRTNRILEKVRMFIFRHML